MLMSQDNKSSPFGEAPVLLYNHCHICRAELIEEIILADTLYIRDANEMEEQRANFSFLQLNRAGELNRWLILFCTYWDSSSSHCRGCLLTTRPLPNHLCPMQAPPNTHLAWKNIEFNLVFITSSTHTKTIHEFAEATPLTISISSSSMMMMMMIVSRAPGRTVALCTLSGSWSEQTPITVRPKRNRNRLLVLEGEVAYLLPISTIPPIIS